MQYLPDRHAAYEHPRQLLDSVRSLLMLAMDYATCDPGWASPRHGRVARYAWGYQDYHELIRERLDRLTDRVRALAPGAQVRGVVDTAPLLEHEFAQLAGLGWIGKNTLLLNKRAGSWFFLAALLTDQELVYDAPHEQDHCGTCRACLDACPTRAFPQPYVLDARRCISYLTIELRTAIPDELRSGIGNWLFGCDICQEVCPWNRQTQESGEPAFQPRHDGNPVDLIPLLALDDAAFRQRFRGTPLWRARRRGLLRNAAIVLGNSGCEAGRDALGRGLRDPEPLVRGACAWALGRLPPAPETHQRLQERLAEESDASVRAELRKALGTASPPA
jgi:epoxyqueuosine reductase